MKVMDPVPLPEIIALAGGAQMEVRQTSAADAERICDLYETLSVNDRHRRFFGAFRPHLDWCRQWADVGSRGGFGVIAIVRREGQPDEVAGEAGYAMRGDGDGDLAVTVAPEWRGWLGPYLLDILVRHAGAAGLANLQAEVLLENGPMLSLLNRRHPVAMAHDNGTVRLSIGATGPVPTWPSGERRPHVLVEVAGRRWAGERAAEAAGLATAMCAGPAARGDHGCPVLDGGRCPLADEADAIIVLLDPDDERSARLVQAHREQSPGTPVLVRHRPSDDGVDDRPAVAPGCVAVEPDGADAVAQVLALVGTAVGSEAQQ
jgi:ribosomal protein S18 acetylase RimI-like enzyme